ncbi:MAG: hypothetical protein EPN38_10570 [Rhodanobacteraceae bacterium]|nr:MAG: hypothetical protein EPN38_10570 [Rhodanobacteraceae bacterium]
MPNVNDDFNRTCLRLDLDPERSGIFTPGVSAVSFSEADLQRFNAAAARVAPGTPALDSVQIAAAARRLSRAVGSGSESRFIRTRQRRAGETRALLADTAWTCEPGLRARMQALIAYMDQGPGLIPADVPVIGGLDAALLVDLAMEHLRSELDEYADFCRYRLGESARTGVPVERVAIDRERWQKERAEELRLERQMRRARGTPYAKGVGPGSVFRVS